MQRFKPTIFNDGLVAEHDMPCAVLHNEPAVIDCSNNVFHPSWAAQRKGWRLVRATNWLQRLALRVFWTAEYSAMSKTTLENAPIGTLAPAVMGGAWQRVERGWKWNGHVPHASGSTFPRPGGDWTGELLTPEQQNNQS